MQIESEMSLVLNLSLWITPRFSPFEFSTIIEKCSEVQVFRETLSGEREVGSEVGCTQQTFFFSVMVLNVISKATLFPTETYVPK